jgi:hypothetical protein
MQARVNAAGTASLSTGPCRGRALALATVLVIIGLCACDHDAPTAATTTPTPTVSKVSIAGSAPTVGATAPFTATATLSDGSTQTVTTQAVWSSSNAGVATVANTGIVTAVGAGEADITATYANVSGLLHITIIRSAPVTVALSGTVTDGFSGGILPNIVVQIADGPNSGKSTKTGPAGTYSISGIEPGTFTVSISAVSYITSTRTVTATADTRLDVVLQRAPPQPFSLFGKVNDVYGGIPFAVISVTSATNPSTGTSADVDGNYRFGALMSGPMTLTISGYGHTSVQKPLDFEADMRLDITLTPTAACTLLYVGSGLTSHQTWDSVPHGGDTRQVWVWTNHPNCSWSVVSVSDGSWLTASPSGGTQTGMLTISIAPNATGLARYGFVRLSPCPSDSGYGFCTGDSTFNVNQLP